MSVYCLPPTVHTSIGQTSIGLSVPSTHAIDTGGRHRREVTAADRAERAVDVVARLGSVVTLTALMVVAAAVIGVPATHHAATPDTTVTATFGGR